jgi:formylglycine-generating enzyme required for sulfatase activity
MRILSFIALIILCIISCGEVSTDFSNNQDDISNNACPSDMIFVKGGSFTMGCVDGEYRCLGFNGETPAHKVTLDDFCIGKYPVTQKQWKSIMGTGMREQQAKVLEWYGVFAELVGEGDDYPVYYVSWDDTQEFIEKLNLATDKKYRLLTEAEWEYAARGGTKSRGYKYAGSNNYNEVAWYYENCGDKRLEFDSSDLGFYEPNPVRSEKEIVNNNGTHPVGTKKPNELGIYDMNGNVSEWVWDWWGEYSSAPQVNPKGPSGGEKRVIRGGSWQLLWSEVHDRTTYWPDIYTTDMAGIGFRLAIGPVLEF